MRVTHGSLYHITVDFIQVIVYYYINNSVKELLNGDLTTQKRPQLIKNEWHSGKTRA